MTVERITAPGLPNPAPDETTHEAHRPHLALPRDNDPEYEALLELLRRDLALNPSTELSPFALAVAQNLPWSIDAGSHNFVFTASATSPSDVIKHRLGRTPVGVYLQSASSSSFLAANVSAVGSASFTANAFVTANTVVTGTFGFYWMVIG